jgi:hypothetical protein
MTNYAPVAYRTVTPQAGAWCDSVSTLAWPIKPLVGTLDYWLDASLECAADSDSVVTFADCFLVAAQRPVYMPFASRL